MNPKCPLCGGSKEDACTTYALDLKETLIVIREVPASICETCGSEWFADEVSLVLENQVLEAQRLNSCVQVFAYPKAA